jgi:hypothetical protein
VLSLSEVNVILIAPFLEPYIETALCFIVPDYRRDEFSTAESIKRIPKLKIAMTITDYFFEKLKAYLPQAEIIKIKSAREFFEAALVKGSRNVKTRQPYQIPHRDSQEICSRNPVKFEANLRAYYQFGRNSDTLNLHATKL